MPKSTVSLELIPHSSVLQFASEMKKAGVVVEDSVGTLWIGAFIDGELGGVTALTPSKTSARIRSSYVDPKFRGQRVYQSMVAMAETLASDMGIKRVTAFFNKRTVPYGKTNGYNVREPNKNGVCFADKNL